MNTAAITQDILKENEQQQQQINNNLNEIENLKEQNLKNINDIQVLKNINEFLWNSLTETRTVLKSLVASFNTLKNQIKNNDLNTTILWINNLK